MGEASSNGAAVTEAMAQHSGRHAGGGDGDGGGEEAILGMSGVGRVQTWREGGCGVSSDD